MEFVWPRWVARSAMRGGFQARVIGLDELAGGTACLGVLQAGNAAIRA
jgi:hypothetical protein